MNLQIGDITFVTWHVYATTIVLMEANCVGMFFTRTPILHICSFNMFRVWHLSLMCYVIDRWCGWVFVWMAGICWLQGRFLVHEIMDNLGVVYHNTSYNQMQMKAKQPILSKNGYWFMLWYPNCELAQHWTIVKNSYMFGNSFRLFEKLHQDCGDLHWLRVWWSIILIGFEVNCVFNES